MRTPNIRCSQSAEGVELAILGEITPYTAEEVIRALSYFKDQPVTITMMSPGGDAFASLGIYDFIKGKDVTVRVYGIAASGASIISAAAKRVEMAAGSYMMIHNAYSLGDGPDHVTDSINDRQVEVFAARSGKTRDKVRKMLAAETFMDAPTAKAEGFADHVFDPMKVAASLNTMKPMSEVIKPEEVAPEVVAEVPAPEPIAEPEATTDPGDEQPEEIEVEIPVTAGDAIKAALAGTFKAKVSISNTYGAIVAQLTDELKGMKAQLDEANAKVEQLQPQADAAADATKAAADATAKAAEVAAEVEKLKSTPIEAPVTVTATGDAQTPAVPAAKVDKYTKRNQEREAEMREAMGRLSKTKTA